MFGESFGGSYLRSQEAYLRIRTSVTRPPLILSASMTKGGMQRKTMRSTRPPSVVYMQGSGAMAVVASFRLYSNNAPRQLGIPGGWLGAMLWLFYPVYTLRGRDDDLFRRE